MNREKQICSECGAGLREDEVMNFDGRVLCQDCYDDTTTVCEDCGTPVWCSNTVDVNGRALCMDCYERNYTTCTHCGCCVANDEASYLEDDPYCDECYSKLDDETIKPYDYKPEPIFYGSGSLYYGVELEIDRGGERNDYADAVLSAANVHDQHIYAKHDGSICDGFEIVSHPMTLDYHTDNMNWQEVMDMALSLGYRSHQTETCGLHIHVSRKAFDDDYDSKEEKIARVVHFVEMHWNELLKFSRRTEFHMSRWASRYGISTTAKDTYKNAKAKHSDRYVAVNLENYATIEFRLFRGTLRYQTFLAALQLTDEICRLAIGLNDQELEGMSWSDFVMQIGADKRELIDYLKAKRLYVNEPVDTEVE